MVASTTGLRTSRRISHVFVLDVPAYPRLMLITDAAINVAPNAAARACIAQNAIDLAQMLGIAEPRVAILAAHRVVHGGQHFTAPIRLDTAVVQTLKTRVPLAPLHQPHQPHQLAPIEMILASAPDLPQVACFDTAFHRGNPELAQMFARPFELHEADLFVYRIQREIGSLAAAPGGLDALVFTAGIGENSAEVRRRVASGLGWLGVSLDDVTTEAGGPAISTAIGTAGRRCPVWVMPIVVPDRAAFPA